MSTGQDHQSDGQQSSKSRTLFSSWLRRSSSSLAVVRAGMRIVEPVTSPVSEALNWQRTFPVTVDRSIGSWDDCANFARFEGGGRRVAIAGGKAPDDKQVFK
jgi:hypothetical protein